MTSGYFIDPEDRKKINFNDCWCAIGFPYSLCKCQMLLLVPVSLVCDSSSTLLSLYGWVIRL